MKIAKIIILCLLFGGFILNCAKHGEAKGKYNAFYSFVSIIIQFFLFMWVGLWNNLF
jgi:hypothetical protein